MAHIFGLFRVKELKMLKNKLVKTVLGLSFFSLLLQAPVLAHSIWFDSTNSEYELLFGHPEIGPEPLTLSKFKEATAYDINKTVVISTNKIQENRIFVEPQGKAAALTAFYDNGFWIQLANGDYKNLTQQEVESANYQDMTNYRKYTKALYAWSDAVSQPFGLPIEIMAQKNPFTLQAGDKLPITVLFKGNQINDPVVEYLGQTISVDKNGVALIPIGTSGLGVIEASYLDPTAINPGVEYAATLTAQAVPEPLTILGSMTAIGLCTLIKRKRQ